MVRFRFSILPLVALISVGCAEPEAPADAGVALDSGVCFDPDGPPPTHFAPDDEATPCLVDDDCDQWDYCDKSPSCKGEGRCRSGDVVCNQDSVWIPVCGCSGLGVDALCNAESTTTCESCPPCDDNRDCGEDQFCNSYSCAGPGGCGVRPESCSEVVEPVCGCDGKPYDNECKAWAAGVRVWGRGACECFTSEDCGPDGWCVGGGCDGPGICEPVSKYCAQGQGGIKRWTCGCDGVDYWNECRAARARVRPRVIGVRCRDL